MQLSDRILNLQESKTLASTARANELKAEGKDIIVLTVGQSDFQTPKYILDYAKEAMYSGKCDHYTATSGALEVRQGICDYYSKYQDLHYNTDEIFIGNGGKQVLYYVFQTILNPGDEVLLPSPYWVSFYEQIRLAGGVPVVVQTKAEDNFAVTPELLEPYRTEKTKAILLNFPSNPTGQILTRDQLQAIGDYAVEHDLMIVTDEMYNELVYNGAKATSIATISDEIKHHTIVVNGVSKTFAMTGWRVGYCFADKDIVAGITKLASQASGNISGVSQYAALGAMSGPQDDKEKMRQTFEDRLNSGYELLIQIPGFNLAVKPQGAFYFFPDVSEAAKRCGYENVDEFSMALLNDAGVATVVGSAFGMSDHIRLSYAIDQQAFTEAMNRIDDFVRTHKK